MARKHRYHRGLSRAAGSRHASVARETGPSRWDVSGQGHFSSPDHRSRGVASSPPHEASFGPQVADPCSLPRQSNCLSPGDLQVAQSPILHGEAPPPTLVNWPNPRIKEGERERVLRGVDGLEADLAPVSHGEYPPPPTSHRNDASQSQPGRRSGRLNHNSQSNLPCPFRLSSTRPGCKTMHEHIPRVTHHLSRAHGLSNNASAISSFNLRDVPEYPYLIAAVCKPCWVIFREERAFRQHGCSKYDPSKEMKHTILRDAFSEEGSLGEGSAFYAPSSATFLPGAGSYSLAPTGDNGLTEAGETLSTLEQEDPAPALLPEPQGTAVENFFWGDYVNDNVLDANPLQEEAGTQPGDSLRRDTIFPRASPFPDMDKGTAGLASDLDDMATARPVEDGDWDRDGGWSYPAQVGHGFY